MLSARKDDNDRVALAFRAHSGWAIGVAVKAVADTVEVVRRWNLEFADRTIAGSLQPYHAAKMKTLKEAEAFLNNCSRRTRQMALEAVGELTSEVVSNGHTIVGCCVLSGSGKPLPDLATTLRSHAAIHTAEGEFFRDALKAARESAGLAVWDFREKNLWAEAAIALCIPLEKIEARLSRIGRLIGPPWRHDEKVCALAGWLILRQSR